MEVEDCKCQITIGFYYVRLPYEYVAGYEILFKVCGQELTFKDLLDFHEDEDRGVPF